MPSRVALVWVEGPDAEGFLNGLLSNDVTAIPVGGSAPALLLDERGRIRAEVRVARDASEAFTLVLDPAVARSVADTFERLHFTEDLELIGPEDVPSLIVWGDAPADAEVAVPGPAPGTTELVGDEAIARLRGDGDADEARRALESARIAAGIPRVGVDTGEKTLVQEAGLQGTHVSFTKGCYLGQETVSRAQHRGGVRRTLRRLASDEVLPVGAAVTLEGTVVGAVTSAAESEGGGVALALLRTTVDDGARVSAGGHPAKVAGSRP